MLQFKKIRIKSLFLLLLLSINTLIISNIIPLSRAASDQIYNPDSKVKYRVRFTISYTSNEITSTSFETWVSRIKNWTETSINENESIQVSVLNDRIVTKPEKLGYYSYDPEDIYNNSYDYYNKTMGGFGLDQNFDVQYDYEITLTGNHWKVPKNITLDVYNKSSPLYIQYTSPAPLCEVNNSQIIAKKNEIVKSETSVYEIAKDIYYFVMKNMNYKLQDDALGALNALKLKEGDCSEYSSLMVALLRAAGIPARKVLGLAIIEGSLSNAQARYHMSEGDHWTYSLSSSSSPIPGHAWVQYYVPGIGWISCDPTWGDSFYDAGYDELQYFNTMDYLHIIFNVGEWYEEGIDPPLTAINSETGIAEFPFIYPIIYGPQGMRFNFEYKFDFNVLYAEIKEVPQDPLINLQLFLLLLGSGSLILIVVLIIAYRNKKKKQNVRPYYYTTTTYRR